MRGPGAASHSVQFSIPALKHSTVQMPSTYSSCEGLPQHPDPAANHHQGLNEELSSSISGFPPLWHHKGPANFSSEWYALCESKVLHSEVLQINADLLLYSHIY